MYDMLKAHAPDIYGLKHTLNQNTTNHNLRSTTIRPDDLRLPCHKVTQCKSSFLSQIPPLWNDLPIDLQQISNRKQFKTNLKQNLLNEYKHKVECGNPSCVDQTSHLGSARPH